MTSQIPNNILKSSSNNVIKIPYSDNQEESIRETSMNVNGFTIVELNEENNNFNSLISLYEEDQDIEIKQQIHLKLKAKSIENYYANYKDELVSNANCSRCLLGNFLSNELLYFKDRKTFISYLKYCFIYSKKNLFMNHFIYMNNKYDLFKINQSFYNGWKFSIPKTLCKCCFLQIINMEFLIFNIKNIICDYNSSVISNVFSEKKVPNFVNKKKRRTIPKSKRITPIKKNEDINFDDKANDINSKINPLVIPISKNENTNILKKKRRRSTSSFFRKRKFKNIKKRKEYKYNKNVIYDSKRNILIINKKNIGNYQIQDDDSIIINSIINDNKKEATNKEKENNKQIKKKEEKLKFISSIKNEPNSLTNKKTIIKEKKLENNNKDINGNRNKNNYLNKSIEPKNTIIINNINNKTGEINMDKVGLIQFNNNLNNFNNYPNKDYNICNNLKQNNNKVLINDINVNYFNIINISFNEIIYLFRNGFLIYKELDLFLKNILGFTSYLKQNIDNNLLINIIQFKHLIFIFKKKLENIIIEISRIEEIIEYKIKVTENFIITYYNFNDLNVRIKQLEEKTNEMKLKYNKFIQIYFIAISLLIQEIDNIMNI